MSKITIIGDGGWGTALALLLSGKKNISVRLWGAFASYTACLRKKRENTKFLPGFFLPRRIEPTSDLEAALECPELIIFAVPSRYLRQVLRQVRGVNARLKVCLSVSKGLETLTLKRMSQVIAEELPGISVSVLSGPNIAQEVAQGIPSAAVCASCDEKLARFVQNLLMTKTFRVYTGNDVSGVELGGALKNIIALACGISDGLGFGTNTKSALITRGLAEITRLGAVMGAERKTFSGLSGIGDIITTCFSARSRNRWLGEQLGRNIPLKEVLRKTEMVIEGVPTTQAALSLSEKHRVDMPITAEVYKVLFNKKNPLRAVESLMKRAKKEEG